MRRWVVWVQVALMALGLAACGDKKPVVSESFVFGTRVEVQVAEAVAESRVREAVAKVLAEFDRMHRTYHAWQPSELTQLNDALAAGQRLHVSREMAGLLLEAQGFSRASDGLFDPGIGRLIALWGFHADSYVAKLPDPAAINAWVRAHPSIAQLKIDADDTGAWVRSSNHQVALDFGGSLKGTALDRAAAILREAGINNALINIGGNVMALGTRYGSPWRVAIQAPRYAGPLAVLELRDGEATGTSGDYQRYFEVDGQRYPHLLDPRTGYPAPGVQSVTIVVDGPNAGVRSDVLTKPLFISGAQWLTMAQRLQLPSVLRVAEDGTVSATANLADRLKFQPHDGKLPDIRRISP
ncbi:MAG: FAD:protein FMN transferase [Fluviibacter sp.]